MVATQAVTFRGWSGVDGQKNAPGARENVSYNPAVTRGEDVGELRITAGVLSDAKERVRAGHRRVVKKGEGAWWQLEVKSTARLLSARYPDSRDSASLGARALTLHGLLPACDGAL